ncbi:MAG TPA: PIG-L family deacetylase [Ohtaekwangia sp.]|uniref:PIG-L family deacetylase n=1 Tax=Ohtaekwangia sp. TaxID=2066019 RepID=UPI002F92FB89
MRSLVFCLLIIPTIVFSQADNQSDAARIKLRLKKLNVLSSVLYMAAHPDDENTRIITYLANDNLATTGYLSLTRGDGGQNLIGPEIRDQLGLIRTQELLAARRIDGGQQFFTRANDFGFSKSADETFHIWNKDEVLSDVVKIFRQYQPDVIITRFPPDERAGHGHHTASAILAQEAFDLAASKDIYPDQLQNLSVWQAKRLYTNTGRWWNTSINESTPGVVTLHVGAYSALLGQSYTEIAAVSRSQHKSQGFGSSGTRGDQPEFLEYIKGAKAEKSIFEGINTTWSRVKGGEKIQPLVTKAIAEFNEENPAASIAIVLQIRKAIMALEPGIWKTRKLQETEQLLVDCLGLYIDVTADKYYVAPGQKVVASIELVNRSGVPVTINRIEAKDIAVDSATAMALQDNIPVLLRYSRSIQRDEPYSAPYWLNEKHGVGLFTVTDKNLIGKPENDPAIPVTFTITIAGERLQVVRPLRYKWTDPAKGELSRPFEIVPPVFLNLSSNVVIFHDATPHEVAVTVKSASDARITGTLRLELPQGWRTDPASIALDIHERGEEQIKTFQVYPASKEETGILKAVAVIDGAGSFDRSIQTIGYDHIPTQTLLPKAEAKVVRLDLKKEGTVIGYIRGAGDETPAALRYMGYTVVEMKNEDVNAVNLKRMDAVVVGVRALNTNPRMGYSMPALLEYVKNGGTLVMQYNTNDAVAKNFSPYSLELSRDRVTEEDAEVRILKPEHPVVNIPNKITAQDFDGWVQERGLYFPNKWDPSFEAILSMNDKKETPKDGSLLVAKYGNGYYIYTSLSFFRELPEGVAGAYKLFANIVSLRGQRAEPAPAQANRKRKNKHT